MITNEDLREEIESVGLEGLLLQDDGLLELEDEVTAALWADAVEATQALALHLDLAGRRRLV